MKLQVELEGLKERINSVELSRVIAYRDQLKESGNFKDFNTRFAWDLLHAVMGTNTICEWYQKYDCKDSHITTLGIRACKDLGLLD